MPADSIQVEVAQTLCEDARMAVAQARRAVARAGQTCEESRMAREGRAKGQALPVERVRVSPRIF